VHVIPQKLNGPGTLRVTVATSGRPATGHLELAVPDGLTATPTPGKLHYDLADGKFAEWEIHVGGAMNGIRFLTAGIRDDQGRIWEDAAAIGNGVDPLEVTTGPSVLLLAPGDSTEMRVRVTNRGSSPLRGEAQVISPYGTWGQDVLIAPWTLPFEVEAGQTTELGFPVHATTTANAGMWWALAKVSAFGHLHYSETTQIEVRPPS
jgi:alpha-mannosidase